MTFKVSAALLFMFLTAPSVLAAGKAFKTKPIDFSCEGGSYAFTLTALKNSRYRYMDGAGNKGTLKQIPAASGMTLTGKITGPSAIEVNLKGKQGFVVIDKKYQHHDCVSK